MSWLSFNESLNSIKGQLSSFASGVLVDGIVGDTEINIPAKNKTEDFEKRGKIPSAELQKVPRAGKAENANSWSWEPPGERPAEAPSSTRDSVVFDLQNKIKILENEKKELIVSLEQLDLDCQQTTDKLVTLKDNLQTSYNDLKADYEKLQKEYGEVLTENMNRCKEIDILRGNILQNAAEESRNLNKSLEDEGASLRMRLREYEHGNEDFSLRMKDENAKLLQENEKSLLRELENLKCENDESKNADQRIKNDDKVAKNENRKLNGENEELKITFEKSKNENVDLEQMKNKNEKLSEIAENFKSSYEKTKMELEQLHDANEELKTEREQVKMENETIKRNYESLKLELEKLRKANAHLRRDYEEMKNEDLKELRSRNEELNGKYEQEKNKNEKLFEDYENLIIANEKLKCDLEKLKLNNEEVKRKLQQLENKDFSSASVNLLDHEKFTKEKEALHRRYLNIITENIRKCIDSDTDVTCKISPILPDEPQILEFAGKVEILLKLLLDFKYKTETLEKELCEVTQEKNKVIAEKNFEIEKLLKNSEILSQEVITKTRAIKDYENECSELMKNNDLLISELQNYKSSSGLQTISESNEDNLLLLESQLENANKRMQDMEVIISDLENSKQEANLETQTELEYIKKQLNMTGQELSHSKDQYQNLLSLYKHLEDEKQSLKSALDKIKVDYENTEYKYTEINVSMETLKEENEEYKKKMVNLDGSSKKLEAVNFNLESKIELLQNVVDDFKQKLEMEMENTAEKELQIRSLVERLQNSKMCETGLKLQVDTICKELQTVTEAKQASELKYNQVQNELRELRQEVVKTKEECSLLREKANEESNLHKEDSRNSNANKIVENVTNDNVREVEQVDLKMDQKHSSGHQEGSVLVQLQNQLENVRQEKQTVQVECSKLKTDVSRLTRQNSELQQKISFLEAQLTDLSASRNELICLITAKHQENVQYHGEIQRLNHLLAAETERAHELETRLLNLKIEMPSAGNSDLLSEELLQKNEEISQKEEEIGKLTDQNNFLREKCEMLAQNLLQEQSNIQKVLADERLLASEKEQSLAKELERLRAHLVEIEEMYTQELLQAEQKNKEMQAKVNEIEQREKNSSSIYTSVSIRANQQVETLQTQLQLVTNQRDELRTKVSDLEDEHNKQVAALTNLQLVLEQFQKERDKDVYQETERVRRQIFVERQIQQELHGEIGSLKLQLEESKQGLQAASRLTDQLEKCKLQIVNLNEEVTKLQDQLKSSEAKYKELSTQTDSKVDKSLIKNLVIGYVTSHSSDQNQILKIISTVLDFNQKESDRVNLNKSQHGGWLTSILHPHSLNSSQSMSQQSLSEAFVRFLENESKPKVLPNLLITNQVRKDGSSSNLNATPRQSPSPLVLSEIVLPTFVDFGKSRNSSSILKDVLKDNS